MSEILIGFVLAVVFLLSLAGAVLGFLAWRETRTVRPMLARGLKVMADLTEQVAVAAHVDPASTGAPELRKMAREAEDGAVVVSAPRKQTGPRLQKMRPLSDEEEWALEQEQRGFDGLSESDTQKAMNWAKRVREDRVAVEG